MLEQATAIANYPDKKKKLVLGEMTAGRSG